MKSIETFVTGDCETTRCEVTRKSRSRMIKYFASLCLRQRHREVLYPWTNKSTESTERDRIASDRPAQENRLWFGFAEGEKKVWLNGVILTLKRQSWKVLEVGIWNRNTGEPGVHIKAKAKDRRRVKRGGAARKRRRDGKGQELL